MFIRLIGAIAVAVGVGGAVVACADTNPTNPHFRRAGSPSFDASSSCAMDTQAPTIIGLTASPNVLTPADRQMVPVFVSWSAVDNCGAPMCITSAVTSNGPGRSDANDVGPVVGSVVTLRAEKGNIYTITVTCRDAAGNTTSASTTVTVSSTTSKCTKDDHGSGDDKNGDVDLDNKCKHVENDRAHG